MKKAYVLDFDETLVTTKARIHVYKNGVHINDMNSKQFNFYIPKKGELLDFSEFKDPELILKAKPYKMWPALKNINKAVKENRSSSDIYILTARSPIVKSAIYEFLKQRGIEIDISHIITIGKDEQSTDISAEKKKWLKRLVLKYDKVLFFDDDPKNIQLAASIKGITTRLVEDMGGVGAPMVTLTNTPGMGNVSPAGSGTLGSGDNFGNTLGNKPYTQGKPLKKKRKKKKKIVKEDMNEKFKEHSDPIKDMGIGAFTGLWDYTPEEAAEEIWANMKPRIQRQISQSQRTGITFVINVSNITEYGCMHLGFEPDDYTFSYLIKLVQKEIDKSISDNTINLHQNIKYYKTNESNTNPYDKISKLMMKRMKNTPVFKKKKEKLNQNAMIQKTFEHQIITLDEFVNNVPLNESSSVSKKGFEANIEQETLNNEAFRKVLYTGENLQLVLMTLKPGENIGMEVHQNDQFFRFEAGNGKVIINDSEYNVTDGTGIIIPAGSNHDIINTGKVALQLYTLYSPPHHKEGSLFQTKEEAEEKGQDFDGQTSE